MKLVVFILLLALCGLVKAQDCGTTECMSFRRATDKAYKVQLGREDAIFEGDVASQSGLIKGPKGFPYRILTINILRYWKGVASKQVLVKIFYYDRDCAERGEKGRLMFYTEKSNDPVAQYSMYWCNKYAFDDQKTTRILGNGKTFDGPL